MSMGSVTSDPLIGRMLDGYKVERLLGRGGMARVYRGFDVNLHRHVAIKVIDPKAGGDLDYKERFRREARAVAQLRHSNIVGVYRFGVDNNVYYMAMDYIDGVDLAWLLKEYDREGVLMPQDEMFTLVKRIASALDFAHGKDVVHRDIKPSNIMLNKTGEPILTDFGLVMVATEETQGNIFGSPYYIAPEQAINSAGAVPQSDLYSLGIMIYQMLTGVTPFNEGTAMQIAMAHMSKPLPDPRQYNPDLSKYHLNFLRKALAKEPEERFQSGAKMVTALQEVMKRTGASIEDTQAQIADKLDKYMQENPPSISIRTGEMSTDPQAHIGTMPEKPGTTSSLRRVLLMLVLLVVLGAGGVFALTQFNEATVNSGVAAAPVMAIQGEVEAVNGRRLTIYGMQVDIPADAEVLQGLRTGDVIYMEGAYTSMGRITTITRLDDAFIVPDEAGE